MRRLFLPVLIWGIYLTACAQQTPAASSPTTIPNSSITTQPSPVLTPPSTFAPTPAPTEQPILRLAEIKLHTHTGTSYSLSWSPDGETLAATGGVEIIFLTSDLHETLATLEPSSGALTVAWVPDQKMFATVVGFRNQTISLWNWDAATSTLTLAREIPAGADQYGVSWSPDGKILASLANDRKSTIQIWDTTTWELVQTYELPYANPRRALNWGPDSKTLYDAGELDGQAVVFALNVENGTVQELAKLPPEQVYAFGASPGLNKFAVADEKGYVRILNLSSNQLLREFQSVTEPVALAWNSKDKTLAILGYKTQLQLWDVAQ